MTLTPLITVALVQQMIREQFPEFSALTIKPVKVQGHDNRSFRLGDDMLIRIPTESTYALTVAKEQSILPEIAPFLTVNIPRPLKLGMPSDIFPFSFSIYQWINGESANHVQLDRINKEQLALALANFLKELQGIETKDGPAPGAHNWWRGDHVSVYDQQARSQIAELKAIIDNDKALTLWDNALRSRWHKQPVWIHGDLATGNILTNNGSLSGIIDFGCVGVGDPACDLVIAWTYLEGKARDIFINEMNLDEDTWLRARAWALWKATFELCNREDKNDPESIKQKCIIEDILSDQTTN